MNELHPIVSLILGGIFGGILGALVGGTFLPFFGVDGETATLAGTIVGIIVVLGYGFFQVRRTPQPPAAHEQPRSAAAAPPAASDTSPTQAEEEPRSS
jgi:predicted lipid-binding transport protein (Tim44 family)